MIVLLTNKCNEMCTHCMECSSPSGLDYDPELIEVLINYLKSVPQTLIHISGGEFTLANNWDAVITRLLSDLPQHLFMLGSNGWWIETPEIRDKIRNLCEGYSNLYGVQISTHKDYYPNYQWTMNHKAQFQQLSKKIKFTDNWQGVGGGSSHLARLGRAKDLIPEDQVTGYPGCSPLLSRAHQSKELGIRSFQEFISCITLAGYFCKPAIDLTSGRITPGESNQCMEFDNLHNYKNMDESQIRQLQNESFNRLSSMKLCNACGAKKNISEEVIHLLNL